MSDDAIPSHAREVLALFAGELRGQRFGDLDAEALEALAARTREAAAEVERARAALDEAHARLAEARDALCARAEQALAYARVFAGGDPSLAARLGQLEPAAAPVERPRKRKPRRGAAVTELPFEARGAA